MQGGGVTCKCINDNGISGGSNGSNVNDGKITVEFTVYNVDGKNVIKKEDVESLFNEILSLDPEKYMFYQFTDHTRILIYNTVYFYYYCCDYAYIQGIDDEHTVTHNYVISGNGEELIIIYRDDDGINYEESKIFNTKITDNLQGTPEPRIIHKLTLYYREL